MEDTRIRVGKVSSIDYKSGMVRVTYPDKGGAVTSEMPYANNGGEYRMPSVGESVVVAHLSNGTSRGVVLGTMWNKSNRPPQTGKGLYRKDLSRAKGEAMEWYSEENKTYLLKAPEIELRGTGQVKVTAQECGFESESLIINVDEGKILKSLSIDAADNNISVDLNAMRLNLKGILSIKTDAEIVLEDGKWRATLSGIMDRLAAIDGDYSGRK